MSWFFTLADQSGNVLIGQKTSAGSLPVTIASDQGPIPVSIASEVGTFTVANGGTFPVQAAQAGSWTVAVSNAFALESGGNLAALATTVSGGKVQVNAGTVPVTGTFYQAVQPVSASALPLPSGASTAAKQPALGTAGTAASDVLSVQGIASMTALKVDGSAVTQPVSGTFWPTTQPVSGTVALSAGAAVIGSVSVTGTVATSLASLPALSAGAAAIGTVGVTSLPALPAGANAIGSVSVSNLPATQAVSGTVTANAGSGTLAVSAASLPLPTGASTAAKQPAFGVAGTASTDVLTVQGINTGVALPVSASSLPLPTGAAIASKQAAPGTAGTPSTDVLTVQGSLSGIATPTLTVLEVAARNGQGYIGSTGPTAMSATLINFRMLFSNPVGSGKTAYVTVLISESSTASMVFATVSANPTTVPSTFGGAINNLSAGGAVAKCTIKADASATAISGGTVLTTLGIPGGASGSRTVFREATFIIPAGVSMAVNIPFGVVTTSNCVIYWIEA